MDILRESVIYNLLNVGIYTIIYNSYHFESIAECWKF